MKKILLIVIDALASRIINPAIERGSLPTFHALIQKGVFRPECTSIFPSITPAATASIATGMYPTDHHIAGAFWFNREEECVAYYGDDFWVMLEEGMQEFFDEFLNHLNHKRLHADTVYQRIERHGMTSAVLNFIWFRGETRHDVNVPLLLKLFPGDEFSPQIYGPRVLGLADFASSAIPGREEKLQATGGITRRFGFHDETTAEYLLHLSTAEPFPDFTLAYFPNNDYASHQEGPAEALKEVQKVDDHLAEFIESRGGIDSFLNEFTIIILGDHSQCDLKKDASARGIDLNEMFKDYQIAKPGSPWNEEDDLMVCPNMRACHIYLQDRSSSARDRVVSRLLQNSRVDQVLWRESAWDHGQVEKITDLTTDRFHVQTEEDDLKFWFAESEDAISGRDIYGNSWSWEGSLAGIDASVNAQGVIEYEGYPNALERIATSFSQLASDLWVTAKIGCEFELKETSIHESGSHGALNRDDSTAPLIIAGLPDAIDIPECPRAIDIAPLCLQALGLQDEAAQLIEQRVAGKPR